MSPGMENISVAGTEVLEDEREHPAVPGLDNSAGGETEGYDDVDPPPPLPFDGDYFGEYNAANFEDFNEYDGPLSPEGDVNISDLPTSPEPSNSEESDEEDASNFEDEHAWEPPVQFSVDLQAQVEDAEDEDLVDGQTPPTDAQEQAESHICTKTHIVCYPNSKAGVPINAAIARMSNQQYATTLEGGQTNLYAPFTSALDWEVVCWAKQCGPGSTAFTDLLKIPGVVERLQLSYSSAEELNAIIDAKISSGRPRFTRHKINIGGEAFEVFYRNIIACICALFGDPEFAGILVFAAERHYTDADHTVCMYFDMHTGKWWWNTQRALDSIRPGGTIIPIIISSDKTQLMLFGSTTANLPKAVRREASRRGQTLLTYLPSTCLEHIANKDSRCRMLINLYHTCLSHVLEPIRDAGIDGVELASNDGVLRCGHPLFALHISMTGTKHGECPKCPVPRDALGEWSDDPHQLCNMEKVLDALDTIDRGYGKYAQACEDAGIKPITCPYCPDLPYVNIYQSIVPDLLHQLYRGVIKHMITCLTKAFGSAELDVCCQCIPLNHNIRLFLKGITKLQRVTGKEHNQMCCFLMGLIVGLPLPDGMSPVHLLRAYPAHTSDTLDLLKDALCRFHVNKAIFVDLGIQLHFKLPKLHSLEHYLLSIMLFGTIDNYDTQYTERLHIDFAKNVYCTLNRTIPVDALQSYHAYTLFIAPAAASGPVASNMAASSNANGMQRAPGRSALPGHLTRIKIARNPSVKALGFENAAHAYGAFLRDALARFVDQYHHPHFTPAEIRCEASSLYLCFVTFSMYHRMKFTLVDAQDLGIMEDVVDTAYARPARKDRRSRPVPERFDIILIDDNGAGGAAGLRGYRVGRIQLLFKLPHQATKSYVEWFSAFTTPNAMHGLGEKPPSVIPIEQICRLCHLFPDFGPVAPQEWTSSSVLDQYDHFWLSSFTDLYMYMISF
ncbi:hypothetical protein PYCCODRAFT_1441641 [Trametes coccinea BRFM310]|uniref:Uncharacterized protein n=1 Tax=Trametes coccinea (strain BRFM310) TaxID=1353009 RepID=A0A1Y2J2V8_TRAC3|nr:hypothetical protein PYCCODRAFT_1441641 [Trametes coccinea BRFM310]